MRITLYSELCLACLFVVRLREKLQNGSFLFKIMLHWHVTGRPSFVRDPYRILGLDSRAGLAEVKAAYRRLAKTCHPDRHSTAESARRFLEIKQAYERLVVGGVLRRPPSEDAAPSTGRAAGAPSGGMSSSSFPGSERASAAPPAKSFRDAFGDFFQDLFSPPPRQVPLQAQPPLKRAPSRGHQEVRWLVSVSFMEAALGGIRRLQGDGLASLDVRIPAGAVDGQILHLPAQKGTEALSDSRDMVIELHVLEHALFRRCGWDIYLELPIRIDEAVLGGQVLIPTLRGRVRVTIPEGSNSGDVLRLKGLGIHPEANLSQTVQEQDIVSKKPSQEGAGNSFRQEKKGSPPPPPAMQKDGHMFVRLKIVVPETPDPELVDFLRKWGARQLSYNPRRFSKPPGRGQA